MDMEAVALNDTYELATKDANAKVAAVQAEMDAVREESRAIGILQKINYDNAHNELLKYVTLYNIKQSKGYKKGGLTWEQFCESIGEQCRNIDRTLKDIEPVYMSFSDKVSDLIKVPFNKIKYLGKIAGKNSDILSENGMLKIGDTSISLTPENSEEIEAAIDTLIEAHKKEQKELKSELNKARKDVGGIVAEETKGLTVERDALVKEVERLKKFEPKEVDSSWAEKQLDELRRTVRLLATQSQILISNAQTSSDRKLQAEIEGKLTEAEAYLADIRREWVDRFFNEN